VTGDHLYVSCEDSIARGFLKDKPGDCPNPGCRAMISPIPNSLVYCGQPRENHAYTVAAERVGDLLTMSELTGIAPWTLAGLIMEHDH
jgi:hypothetical protein